MSALKTRTPASVLVAVGSLSRGFRLSDAALQIYAETDVFEEEHRAAERRRSVAQDVPLGPSRSEGRRSRRPRRPRHRRVRRTEAARGSREADGAQEFLELRYAGEDKLFVPVERLDLVQKYTGGARPALDRLGGTSWEKAKTRVKKAMRDMAEELLKLYAQRKAVPGHAFAPTRTGRRSSKARSRTS